MSLSSDRAHLNFNSKGDRRLLLNKTKTIDALQCVELAIMRLLGLIAASEVDRHRKSLISPSGCPAGVFGSYIHTSIVAGHMLWLTVFYGRVQLSNQWGD